MSEYKIDYCHHDSVTAESRQEYIKREDAYREIMECFKNSEMPEEWEHGMHTAGMIVLQDVPSADVVEVKHGHWVFYGVVDDIYGYGASCSVCGGYSEDNGYYCSCCGAKMDDALQRKTNPEAF